MDPLVLQNLQCKKVVVHKQKTHKTHTWIYIKLQAHSLLFEIQNWE